MGLFAYFNGAEPQNAPSVVTHSAEKAKNSFADPPAGQPTPDDVPLPQLAIAEASSPAEPPPKPKARLLSIPTFTRPSPSHKEHSNKHRTILTGAQEHERESNVVVALSKRIAFSRRSKSENRAKNTALMVRDIISGPSASSPTVTTAIAKPRMSKLKSDLSKPKTANKVIAQLRALPPADNTDSPSKDRVSSIKSSVPIHAVCLEHSDEKEDELHFAQLSIGEGDVAEHNPVDQFSTLISEMRVVDFLKSADFGLGQPGDGEGLLAGAIPTAETVINGIERITPELMALGYATGRSIAPDHTGVYPPTDRISVITYWWGLEVILPTPTIAYLGTVKSISNTAVNYLSAISLASSGVREILPFVRYMAQFIEFEFNAIKGQDKGQGVVCAATWIMPAALVPRPWDFPTPPLAPGKVVEEPSEEPATDKGGDVKPDSSVTKVPPAPAPPAAPNSPTTPPTVTNPPARVPPSAPYTQPEDASTNQPAIPSLPIMIPVT
ncbi:hypothetical protein E1B28_000466 [Marasmius oreades]|uniref:Uncharacterized protein n=1 Tax=Marasmius oreades TaxID=181124 RepID=A0A9P7V1J4_9AGAR|nr:uncharacterized protein E1B28_000466 [Marasmius oreades]KAG7098527.1 hypothetical protein E1B28_000466 [Marasmius oreades]